MEPKRLQKVSRLIQKEMGEILQQESRTHFGGAMITVTRVNITADLSIARLNLSIFPLGKETTESIFKLIVEKRSYLRNILAQRIRNQIRIIPNLQFFIDDSLDYIENIERLLKE